MFRLITLYVPTKYITKPISIVWINAIYKPAQMIPEKFRIWVYAAGTFVIMLLGTFVPEDSADNTRANRAVSFFGLLVFLGFLYLTSRNRKAIQWQTVIVGNLLQFLLGLFVLKTKAGVSHLNSWRLYANDLPNSMTFLILSHTLQELFLALQLMEPLSLQMPTSLNWDTLLSMSFHLLYSSLR
jgi:CNT family concentrative nucleoside transporter